MIKRIVSLITAIFLLLAVLSGCAPQGDVLLITVLDVGQGDCILLTAGGRHFLIDTGSAASRGNLLGELDRLGVDDPDAILITHPHEDHYGNARMLIEGRSVPLLMLPECGGDETGYGVLLESAAQTGTQIRVLRDAETFSWGGAVCEVFCPISDSSYANNAGLVLRVRYGACVLLLMGDAEWQAEDALLARGGDWKCDFLKVGHHGSRTACSAAFLQATAPQSAAISCDADNAYGFPHREVLEGLAAVGATVYRTDTQGTLRFVCDGSRVIFEE